MLNKIYIKIMLLLVGAALVTGCEKSGLQPYTGGNTVGFWVHSINHSFYGEGVETLPKDTIVLDLAITGDVVDYDRHVDGTFILDAAGTEEKDLKNTAVELPSWEASSADFLVYTAALRSNAPVTRIFSPRSFRIAGRLSIPIAGLWKSTGSNLRKFSRRSASLFYTANAN